MQCTVCGGVEFAAQPILWPRLIDEWQLSPSEAAYIDRQQGECCTVCGANLRSIALANALRAAFETDGLLTEFVVSPRAQDFKVLEINAAGMLNPVLSKIPGHILATFPSVDMHALPWPDRTFDVVTHSDTLEHVSNPIHALAECRRVLKPGGALCLTVPIVVGRMTRGREGLPESYHGSPGEAGYDFVVHSEFGADAWCLLMQAGFSQVTMFQVEYPAAIAMAARI